jgi:hypothetical protein
MAATPGPWRYLRGKDDLPGLKEGHASIQSESPNRIGFKDVAHLRPDESVRTCMTQGKAEWEWANAEFMAAASPSEILSLIDRCQTAEAERDRLAAALDTAERALGDIGFALAGDFDAHEWQKARDIALQARAKIRGDKK